MENLFARKLLLVVFVLCVSFVPGCKIGGTSRTSANLVVGEAKEAMYADALELMGAGSYQEARISLEKLVAAGEENPAIFNELGVCAIRTGDLPLAKWAFEQAMVEDPEAVQPSYNLGMVYEQLGKLERAAEFYQTAYQLSDSNILILGTLARAQFKLGLYSEQLLFQLREIEASHPSNDWIAWSRQAQVRCLSSIRSRGTTYGNQSGQNETGETDD